MAVDLGVAVGAGPDVARVVMAEVVRGDSAGNRTICPPLSLPYLCHRSLARGHAEPLREGRVPSPHQHAHPSSAACPVAMGSLGAGWPFTCPC